MERYRRVTGKILSRDSYREDGWDPGQNQYVQNCVYTMRVEYTVDGIIYTHSFSGENICGKTGDSFEMLYPAGEPENVKPAESRRKSRKGQHQERQEDNMDQTIISEGRKKNRKKVVIAVICVICILGFLVYHFLLAPPSIINVPDGFTDAKEYLNKVGVQDSSDYCVYQYDSADPVAADPLYEVMTEADVQTVRGYFEDAKDWPDMEESMKKQPFDENCISEGDYYLIDTKEGETNGDHTYGTYENYSVWFFDVESCTLYFIHNDY